MSERKDVRVKTVSFPFPQILNSLKGGNLMAYKKSRCEGRCFIVIIRLKIALFAPNFAKKHGMRQHYRVFLLCFSSKIADF